MRKEYTINYRETCCSETGTVYRQTINISRKTWDRLLDILRTELVNPCFKKEDYIARMYLNSQIIKAHNVRFLNLTQRDFFNKYLKLKLLDRNTCLYLID